jgi:tRNA-splicing ligase RtcB
VVRLARTILPQSACDPRHGRNRRAVLVRQLANVWIDAPTAARRLDEAPAAYKDLDAVMRAQRDLGRIVRRLRPALCYKGA